MLCTLDLFSGIGGFSLGLERTNGFRTAAFCEQAEYPRRVLAKNWPGVPIYDDIRTLSGTALAADGIISDVVCGGFPCQDISIAGRGAGLSGDRSGLWYEMLRIIDETRPRYVIAENVAALRGRGLDTCLRGLAEIGYDAEWHVISAAAIGAPHKRERVWIIAYPNDGEGRRVEPQRGADRGNTDLGGHGACGSLAGGLANPAAGGRRVDGHERGADGDPAAGQLTDGGAGLADASGTGLPSAEQPPGRQQIVTTADIGRAIAESRWRRSESRVGEPVDGVSPGTYGSRGVEPWEGSTPRTVGKGYLNRRARLMALGNAVVPAIPELIGRAILRAEGIAA